MTIEFQQRVIKEKAELDARLRNLSDSTHTQGFQELHEADQLLVVRQLSAMRELSAILAERIERFPVLTPVRYPSPAEKASNMPKDFNAMTTEVAIDTMDDVGEIEDSPK